MSDEPLRLTLAEAMMRLNGINRWLEHHGSGVWVVYKFDETFDQIDQVAIGATWPEAISAALGCTVVERDDRAELEASLRTHLKMVAGYTDQSVHGIQMDVLRALCKLRDDRAELVKALRELLNQMVYDNVRDQAVCRYCGFVQEGAEPHSPECPIPAASSALESVSEL